MLAIHKYSPTWALDTEGKTSELPSTVDTEPTNVNKRVPFYSQHFVVRNVVNIGLNNICIPFG